jgi:hypothetical protein
MMMCYMMVYIERIMLLEQDGMLLFLVLGFCLDL